MRLLKEGEPLPALRKPVFVTLDQINPSSTGANVLVRILSLARAAGRREDGQVLEAEVGDHTATATLLLNKARFPGFKAGDVVALRNLKIKVVKGFCLLDIDPWGRVTAESGQVGEVRRELNVSRVLYELKD